MRLGNSSVESFVRLSWPHPAVPVPGETLRAHGVRLLLETRGNKTHGALGCSLCPLLPGQARHVRSLKLNRRNHR